MKTLKEEVMELLMKRIGVAENEEFEARLVSEEYFNNKFYEGKLLTKNSKGEWHDNSMWAVFIKYFDVYEFKVKPFKPVGGETYWIVTALIILLIVQTERLGIVSRQKNRHWHTKKRF